MPLTGRAPRHAAARASRTSLRVTRPPCRRTFASSRAATPCRRARPRLSRSHPTRARSALQPHHVRASFSSRQRLTFAFLLRSVGARPRDRRAGLCGVAAARDPGQHHRTPQPHLFADGGGAWQATRAGSTDAACVDAARGRAQVRRLRIQQRVKTGDIAEDDLTRQEFKSALPLLPPLTETSINDYYVAFVVLVAALIAFGGYIAPMAEVKLGLGCASCDAWRAYGRSADACVAAQRHFVRRVRRERRPAQTAERGA